MGSNMNFNPFGNEAAGEGGCGGGAPLVNFPLMRQSSVYSLTFDEFQSSLGKDFGSVNMDELLRSIWSAEETQNPASAGAATAPGGLQRQGSITLPRTLSVKTVEEVWRGMNTESGASVPQAQRQPTLGEVTLEEFLVRAGVVREDSQMDGRPNHGGFWGNLGPPDGNNDSGFGFSFQQPSNNGGGLMGSRIADNNAQISLQSTNLPMNANGIRSSQAQPIAPQLPQRHQHPIYPKQGAASYAPPMAVPSSIQLASLAHGGAMGMVGMGGGGLGGASGSPASLSSDGLKSNRDTPSISPVVPYMFNGGVRGRRSNNTVEKVIERRHKRMIKNRESAARSRQRKQAYTMELEQEINKLKEENEELQNKQAKIMEIQKKQAMDALFGAKRRCLRRTHTGPW